MVAFLVSILGDLYDAQIKKFEGYTPRATWDYKQSSVGWGTRARAPNEVIDQTEAQRRYDEEIAKAHGLVRSFAPNLGAGPAAALTSLTYNAGGDWMKSGLGRAIQAGDMDRAKSLFLQYVNAGGKPLEGLRNRRAAEVGWFDGAQGQTPTPQQPTPQPMALGGPPQASEGQPPMAQGKGGFLDEIVARASNPMFQQGLGLFLASAQGKDMNAGLSEGQQRARSMQETLMKNLALQREAQQREAVQSVMSNPQTMQGVPPALVQMARATGDPSAVVNWMSRTQRDPLATRHQELQNKVLERNLSQPPDEGARVVEVNGQLVRVGRDGKAEVIHGSNAIEQAQQAVAARRAQAVAAGMDPESGPVKTFIATGKMPREDQAPLTATDKKAIIEADDQVIAATNVINLLGEAEKINPQAHTGVLAGARATVGNMLPDALVPDAIASKGSSEATANFENLVLGQALAQLKSTFGAAPTEGERKILVELQGSVNQPITVRRDILRRAKALAEKRLRENQERASQLRAGTFYKPEDAKSGGGTNGASGVLDEARAAISKGAPREAVIQRLRERGVDPTGL